MTVKANVAGIIEPGSRNGAAVKDSAMALHSLSLLIRQERGDDRVKYA
jgi:hypothetical protein